MRVMKLVVLAMALGACLSACVVGPNVNRAAAPAFFALPAQLPQAINIRVLDLRPKAETTPDPQYADGHVYTTYGAEAQARNFAIDMGENILRGHGAPGYRNLNANQMAQAAGLDFTFTLRHWYAKWPLRNSKDLVVVEGEFDVLLEVSKDGKLVYAKAYRTEGVRQVATLTGINRDNYSAFVHQNLGAKGNQLLGSIIGSIMTDLQKNWSLIVNGDAVVGALPASSDLSHAR